MDILIDLPAQADLAARKIVFKQKLYAYLMEKGAF